MASIKWIKIGLLTFILGFGSFIGWGILAPLSSASLAVGNIVVKGERKAVQHFEGGIVDEILVTEGQYVQQGELLFKLAQDQSLNIFEEAETRYLHAKAAFQRIESEISGTDKLEFHGFDMLNPKVSEMLMYQREQFRANQHKLSTLTSLQIEKKEQSEQQLNTLLARQASDENQLKIAQEQVTMYQELAKKGYSSRAQDLAAQSHLESIQGRLNEYIGLVQKAKAAIEESKVALASIQVEHQKTLRESFEKQQELLKVRESEYLRLKDVVDRTNIKSPISGYVVNLSVHTINGVINPSQVLLEIVPDNEDLIVEALLNPTDIESVTEGLKAKVRLSAYNMRRVPPIEGVLEHISADKIYDEERGVFAYKVKVSLSDLPEHITLYPGMPAEVMVLLEERTPLDYLLSPLLEVNFKAFRESS